MPEPLKMERDWRLEPRAGDVAKCRMCGLSDMLVMDPAGYYRDAKLPAGHPQAGVPLACRRCRDGAHLKAIGAL